MNTNKIYDINKDYLELPFSLEKSILILFGVSSFDKFSSTQKDKISNSLSDLFSQTKKVDYSKIAKEYTLYYLPINMYSTSVCAQFCIQKYTENLMGHRP